MKTIQYFKDEDLENSKNLSPTEIAQFLEDFRNIRLEEIKENKLISMRVDSLLLKAFKEKCESDGIKYQKQIRLLMQEFLVS